MGLRGPQLRSQGGEHYVVWLSLPFSASEGAWSWKQPSSSRRHLHGLQRSPLQDGLTEPCAMSFIGRFYSTRLAGTAAPGELAAALQHDGQGD